MSINKYIIAYLSLSNQVFQKKARHNKGQDSRQVLLKGAGASCERYYKKVRIAQRFTIKRHIR